MMRIEQRIQALRIENDISQRELADKVEINYSVMNRIESGERPVRDEEIKKIAQVLQVSTDYLLGISDIKNPYEPITIAAHHDGTEYTDEEKADIERFKEFVKMKRQK